MRHSSDGPKARPTRGHNTANDKQTKHQDKQGGQVGEQRLASQCALLHAPYTVPTSKAKMRTVTDANLFNEPPISKCHEPHTQPTAVCQKEHTTGRTETRAKQNDRKRLAGSSKDAR